MQDHVVCMNLNKEIGGGSPRGTVSPSGMNN